MRGSGRSDLKEEDLPLSGQDLSNEIATINSKDRYNSSVVVSSQAAQLMMCKYCGAICSVVYLAWWVASSLARGKVVSFSTNTHQLSSSKVCTRCASRCKSYKHY